MNLDKISTRKLLVSYITALVFTAVLTFLVTFGLDQLGVHWVFFYLTAIILFWSLPATIAAWILQEELKAMLSQLNDKRDE